MNLQSKEREKAVLECIKKATPLPPTILDIQDATGIPSSSVVNYYLNKLERDGKIRRIRNKNGHTVTRGYLPVEISDGN